MTLATFTWNPDLGATRDMMPAVKPTSFGDGYEVRIPIGINTNRRKWTVTFPRNYEESAPIDAFLENCGGTQAFIWTDPKGDTNVYVCRSWKWVQKEFGVYVVSGVFEQVFEAQ